MIVTLGERMKKGMELLSRNGHGTCDTGNHDRHYLPPWRDSHFLLVRREASLGMARLDRVFFNG